MHRSIGSDVIPTLLVIDDDPSIHELITPMLAGENRELDSVGSTGMQFRVASRGWYCSAIIALLNNVQTKPPENL
jgi:hypothetical protein